MYEFRSFRSRGQAAILVALVAIAVVAFVALAVDGGQAYSLRRQAQNAADGAAIAGTYVMVDYVGISPKSDILRNVNAYAEANGVRDTNGAPGDPINDNVLAYYVDYDGNRLQFGGADWEIHAGPDVIPGNARGVEAVVAMTTTTFFARVIEQEQVRAGALATAIYQPDGGILPIAVNEYWLGSQGHCPYTNCGEPYSFVRDPAEQPPFTKVSESPEDWDRNYCADPYNDNTCQGPYEGYGENYGKALALLGGDAKPNYGSMQPRSAVELDYRYDAIINGGRWHALIASETWQHDVAPIADGQGKAAMEAVIASGGYSKVPIPLALHEPPPEYIDGWGYCWDTPSPDNCFNYPESGHSEPYYTLQFLSGTAASFLAQAMYDDGNYVEGRYAPGERIVILVYNSFAGDQWGYDGKKSDAAAVIGYFGAVIVGYGNDFDRNCGDRTPGDWQTYVDCIKGNVNTTYGIAGPGGDLTIDPSKLLDEFLPQKITLIK